MRTVLLTTLVLATAFAGCTDSDADGLDANLDLGATAEVLVNAGDVLGTLTFADDVPIPPAPGASEVCQVGSMGVGQTSWEIPEVDPDTGAAWIASSVVISASIDNPAAGFSYVMEVHDEAGTTVATETAEQGASKVEATLTDAEAGAYDVFIHLCQGAAQLVDQSGTTAFSVAGQAEMVATETIYGASDSGASASGSASGSASADP